MSGGSSASLHSTSSPAAGKLSPSVGSIGCLNILKSGPPPEQWTLVNEVNMENREPCEIWRSGVNHQLIKMKEQMSFCGSIVEELEADIALDKELLHSHRQHVYRTPPTHHTYSSIPNSTQSTPTTVNTVIVQTDKI